MAMVGVDFGSLQADSQPKSSGLVLGQRPLILSSNEPGELSQWQCATLRNADFCGGVVSETYCNYDNRSK